jgi:hypothetical protein
MEEKFLGVVVPQINGTYIANPTMSGVSDYFSPVLQVVPTP